MAGVVSLPFPSSRILAGWWRQLESLAPERWWVGHWFVHRVEAAVLRRETEPLPALERFVLQAIELGDAPGVALAELENLLGSPGAILPALLAGLLERGLVHHSDTRVWGPTAAGVETLRDGGATILAVRRLTFPFVEARDERGRRVAPAPFLPLAEASSAAVWQPEPAEAFDPAWLRACIDNNRGWKESQGFPVDVQELLAPDQETQEAPFWRRVVIDRPQQVFLVVIDTPTHRLGFVAAPADWRLSVSAPAFSLPRDAALPVREEPSVDECRAAFGSWVESLHPPAPDLEASILRLAGARLQVQAPARLAALIRQGKSEVARKEAWLLIGAGEMRRVARLELE